jgi:hypothetical protein
MTFCLVAVVAGWRVMRVRRLRERVRLAGGSSLRRGRVKAVAEELAIIRLEQVFALPSARWL